MAAISTQEQLLSEVQYTIAEEKFGPDIKCIAVGKIELTDDSDDFSELNKVELVRRTLVGNLFQQNYTQVPLATVDGLLNDNAGSKTLLSKLVAMHLFQDRYILCQQVLCGCIVNRGRIRPSNC